ncbi:MAG TPA: hypothetical protein VFG39_09170 [Balneolaceae bacterium]|nr:hypothetical protein [Balneolaceae bacterium]
MNYSKKILKRILPLIAVIVMAAGCKDYQDLNLEPVQSGEADFSTYVAVGNSITAGFQSNALYESAQRFSYPNLLARAMRLEDFEQPLISDPGIGDPGRIELVNLQESITTFNTSQGKPINTGIGRPYNNVGVPGIKIDAYLDGAPANPFYPLIVNSGTPTEPLPNIHQALEILQPTLVTFWLGNNDVLGYVTSGGLISFTNPADFQTQYVSSITAIQNLESDPTVVTVNIPSVSSIAFTTTVGPQFQATIANNNQVPGIVVQKTFYEATPTIGAEENRQPAALIAKENLDNPDMALILLTGKDYLPYLGVSAFPQAPTYNQAAVEAILNYWRGYIVNAGLATEEQAAALTQQQIEDMMTQITIGQYQQTFGSADAAVFAANYPGFDFNQPFGLSPQNPFPNQFVLDSNEISIANTVTGIFNSVIATQGDLQFDVNSFFNNIVEQGSYVTPSGLTLTPEIGSLFSLDGIHPSNQAHAVIANKIIEVLNSGTGSNIERIDVSKIPQGIPVASGAVVAN